MPSVDMNPVSLFFLVFALGYPLALFYISILRHRRDRTEGTASAHVFSLIVPARDEAAVIEGCVTSLLALDYPADRFEILVVDDSSVDGTSSILERYVTESSNVSITRLSGAECGRGKATVLNRAFLHLRENSRFQHAPNWIIGIFDADGHPDRDMLRKASFQFLSPAVAGVQASVRIRNRDSCWLTRMQDIEFAGFSRMTQLIRMRITGSAALGGNGQFVRACSLVEAAIDAGAGIYWKPDALTEDLELSSRLILRNWDLRHLDTSRVWQQGVEATGPLLRQRTRWAWGSLQVFVDYVLRLRIFTAPNVRLWKRLDLFFNLSMFLVSPLVLLSWSLSAFMFLGLVNLRSSFPPSAMFLLAFGYLPIVGYGLATLADYSRRRLPLDLLGFAIYTYHWIPCLYLGLWRLISRRAPIWWKTMRYGETAPG
jgi:cellulose synthase/poly-beta-1,6-N-acetylglucosamine synthase-like glycosyltransferase